MSDGSSIKTQDRKTGPPFRRAGRTRRGGRFSPLVVFSREGSMGGEVVPLCSMLLPAHVIVIGFVLPIGSTDEGIDTGSSTRRAPGAASLVYIHEQHRYTGLTRLAPSVFLPPDETSFFSRKCSSSTEARMPCDDAFASVFHRAKKTAA